VKPGRIGVVGAGTMGAGIAQLGAAAGIATVLHDPVAGALDAGAERIRAGLAKWVEKGRADVGAATLLEAASEPDALAGCELVIEAAPERLELKQELFRSLEEVCGPDVVLATNTSSIPVTSIASALERPENVVGMHFFNPPPLMRLLEVIRADQTGERALAVARATGETMGKDVIVATDGPGFLVNRCGRPFYTEALRIVQERLATPEQVDRVCRLGGGFRMGPFELMDLVGVDVGFAVAQSFAELSFGEPRWRPSMLQARLVAAGRLGRKSGRGWYEYGSGPHRPDDPEPPPPGGGDGRVVEIEGEGAVARELRERAAAAGYVVRQPGVLGGSAPELIVDVSAEDGAARAGIVAAGPVDPAAGVGDPAARAGIAAPRPGGGPPLLLLCADRPLAARAEPHAVGFNVVAPLADARLAELTRLRSTPDAAADAADRFFADLGFHREWVKDGPGLILGRIVAQIVNEAMFAVGEGVGSAADVDTGVTLGLNYPRGALAWGDAIGLDHVLATVDGLWAERHEDRYRAAPALRQAVRAT
jgi:3-hydroxybutyryl-CoA dehydrogenase